jgi:transposase
MAKPLGKPDERIAQVRFDVEGGVERPLLYPTKKEKEYGDRWSVECAFSVIKRIFGEYVSAKKFVNMAKEMSMKVSLYNMFMRMIPHGG